MEVTVIKISSFWMGWAKSRNCYSSVSDCAMCLLHPWTTKYQLLLCWNILQVGSADHHIHYYDLRNASAPLYVFKGHQKAVSYVKFLSSNELASASTDSTLRLWDVQKNCSVCVFFLFNVVVVSELPPLESMGTQFVGILCSLHFVLCPLYVEMLLAKILTVSS